MEDLLEQTVVMKGVQIGRVVDLIFGARDELIGFEVRCQDGQHRFLPSAAASRHDHTIAIESPFALLDADQLEFYRRRGRTLRTRRAGSPSR
jgi:hypothetical protein